MFLKFIALTLFGSYLATDASHIIQDVDPGLTDVKKTLKEVVLELFDLKSEISGLSTRLENLEHDKGPPTHGSKSTTACQDGWMAYKGSCYYFGTSSVTFTKAKVHWKRLELCRSLDAHLVFVESQEENHFLKDYMLSLENKNIHYWIGMTDEEVENVWKLTAGNKTASTFFDWKPPNEPGGGTIENCARFASEHQYRWGDVSCFPVARNLCKKNVN